MREKVKELLRHPHLRNDDMKLMIQYWIAFNKINRKRIDRYMGIHTFYQNSHKLATMDQIKRAKRWVLKNNIDLYKVFDENVK